MSNPSITMKGMKGIMMTAMTGIMMIVAVVMVLVTATTIRTHGIMVIPILAGTMVIHISAGVILCITIGIILIRTGMIHITGVVHTLIIITRIIIPPITDIGVGITADITRITIIAITTITITPIVHEGIIVPIATMRQGITSTFPQQPEGKGR